MIMIIVIRRRHHRLCQHCFEPVFLRWLAHGVTHYLPLALIVALLVGLIIPAPGRMLGDIRVGPQGQYLLLPMLLVMTMFIINGLCMDTGEAKRAITNWKPLAYVLRACNALCIHVPASTHTHTLRVQRHAHVRTLAHSRKHACTHRSTHWSTHWSTYRGTHDSKNRYASTAILVVTPFVALGLLKLPKSMGMEQAFVTGFIIFNCMPTTLSSGVTIVRQACACRMHAHTCNPHRASATGRSSRSQPCSIPPARLELTDRSMDHEPPLSRMPSYGDIPQHARYSIDQWAVLQTLHHASPLRRAGTPCLPS